MRAYNSTLVVSFNAECISNEKRIASFRTFAIRFCLLVMEIALTYHVCGHFFQSEFRI